MSDENARRFREHGPDWERLERDVVERIRLVRAAWDAAVRNAGPNLGCKIRQDVLVPALRLLAEFCTAVRIEEANDE